MWLLLDQLENDMGITRDLKKFDHQQIATLIKLEELGKLPKGGVFDTLREKVFPVVRPNFKGLQAQLLTEQEPGVHAAVGED